MKKCLKCGAEIPYSTMINGKLCCLFNRKFCLVCSPYKQHNTRDLSKILETPAIKLCCVCNTPINNHRAKFCSKKCAAEKRYLEFISSWLKGEKDGIRGGIAISRHIRRYLFELRSAKCELCGWNKIHPITGLSPLNINHKDGNWKNNCLENLQLLCPNCHALTENYGSLNTGNGRPFYITKKVLHTTSSKNWNVPHKQTTNNTDDRSQDKYKL